MKRQCTYWKDNTHIEITIHILKRQYRKSNAHIEKTIHILKRQYTYWKDNTYVEKTMHALEKKACMYWCIAFSSVYCIWSCVYSIQSCVYFILSCVYFISSCEHEVEWQAELANPCALGRACPGRVNIRHIRPLCWSPQVLMRCYGNHQRSLPCYQYYVAHIFQSNVSKQANVSYGIDILKLM